MELASVAVKRKFSSGEKIWEMGDPGEFIAIVVSGLVEISRYTLAEEEITMGVFGPSDVVGLSAMLKKTTYPGSAKSISKGSELIKLYLRPILRGNNAQIAELQVWIREMVLQHEQVLRDKVDMLNAGSVENRILELLNHLIRRFGKQESRFRYLIPIRLTRAQIGKLVGARVETIIRITSRWQKQKLIAWKETGILIDNLPLLEKSLLKK